MNLLIATQLLAVLAFHSYEAAGAASCNQVPADNFPIAVSINLAADNFSGCNNVTDPTDIEVILEQNLHHVFSTLPSMGSIEVDLEACPGGNSDRNLRGSHGRATQMYGYYNWFMWGDCAHCGTYDNDGRRLLSQTTGHALLNETEISELNGFLSDLLTEQVELGVQCLFDQNPTVVVNVANIESVSSENVCDGV